MSDDDYKTYAEVIEEAKRAKGEREWKAYLEIEMAWSRLADDVSNWIDQSPSIERLFLSPLNARGALTRRSLLSVRPHVGTDSR